MQIVKYELLNRKKKIIIVAIIVAICLAPFLYAGLSPAPFFNSKGGHGYYKSDDDYKKIESEPGGSTKTSIPLPYVFTIEIYLEPRGATHSQRNIDIMVYILDEENLDIYLKGLKNSNPISNNTEVESISKKSYNSFGYRESLEYLGLEFELRNLQDQYIVIDGIAVERINSTEGIKYEDVTFLIKGEYPTFMTENVIIFGWLFPSVIAIVMVIWSSRRAKSTDNKCKKCDIEPRYNEETQSYECPKCRDTIKKIKGYKIVLSEYSEPKK